MPNTNFREPILHAGRSTGDDYSYRAGMGMVNSAEWVVFFDDFAYSVGAETSTTNVPSGWEADIIDTGCVITNADLAGGVIEFNSDAANEGAAIYLPKSVALNGKKFFMECRVKMEDVSAMTFQMGLSDLTAVTNPEDIWTTATTDYVSLGNLDTAVAVLTYDKDNGGTVTETNSVGGVSTTTPATLADDTYAVLALAYNGATTLTDGSLSAWVDGVRIANALTEAQVPDDLPLAPFIGMLAGHATTSDVAHVDYFRFALER